MAYEMAHDDHVLTKASEDYLEAIYRLSLEGAEGDGSVRSVDVAERLGVSKASVNKALSTLKEADMVEQSRYGRVALTEKGREYAALVWRAHRTLKLFLESDLGVEPERADSEACLMEHALSADTMLRLIDYLRRQGLAIPE